MKSPNTYNKWRRDPLNFMHFNSTKNIDLICCCIDFYSLTLLATWPNWIYQTWYTFFFTFTNLFKTFFTISSWTNSTVQITSVAFIVYICNFSSPSTFPEYKVWHENNNTVSITRELLIVLYRVSTVFDLGLYS